MMDSRMDVRGTNSYLAAALKNQSSYWVTEINKERRRRGLSAIPVTGKSWDQLDEAERRNVREAKMQDRLKSARDDKELLRLQAELKRLKAEIARES